MAALLLEKSQTSMTESSSPLVLVKEAAERSSPLSGADLGRSKTGNRRRFFLIADKGLGPENEIKEMKTRCLKITEKSLIQHYERSELSLQFEWLEVT